MNVLSPWIDTLGWTLLHFLWQGALIAALFALARAATSHQRADLRYALGLGALALLALSPVATLVWLAPVAGAAGAADAVSSLGAISAVAETARGFDFEILLPWLVGTWVLGVLLLSARAINQFRRLQHLCHEGSEPVPEWQVVLERLSRQFGVSRPVRLLRSIAVETPCLIGWLTPVIVLPAATLVGLSPAQIELVLAHELGHIRRWDYAVNAVQIAIETVLFYHPAVHWISNVVREEREACCDDLVLKLGADPVRYAETLASLEELRADMPAPVLAASGGFLLGRIRRIVGLEPVLDAPRTAPIAGLALLLALTAALGLQRTHVQVQGQALLEAPARLMPMVNGAVEAPAPAALDSASSMAATAVAAVAAAREPALPASTEGPTQVGTGVESEPQAVARPAFAFATGARPSISTDLRDLGVQERSRLALVDALPTRGPKALLRVAPVFDQNARVKGIEGSVSLTFLIGSNGQPREIKVREAYPTGQFEAAAVTALRGWRFDISEVDLDRRYEQSFDFALGTHGAGPDEADCAVTLGSHICRRGEISAPRGTRLD